MSILSGSLTRVRVKPQEYQDISLGNFTATRPPKGFSVQITPQADRDLVVTHLKSLGTDKHYEIVLHVANYAAKPVTAEICGL